MAARAEELKADLLERVLKRVQERMDPDRRAAVEDFVQQFYAHIPPVDLADVSADNLYGAALAIWGFAQKRPAGGPKIRTYNPRLEEHGWRSSHTIVEIVNDDMPFLVDSVTSELNRLDVEVHLIIHPIMAAERDAQGRLSAYHAAGLAPDTAVRESLMHIQISEQPPERLEEVEAGLLRVLSDVRAAVEDWPEMRGLCQTIIAELEKSPPPLPKEDIEEGLAFLKWLDNDHFTYLGYREYVFEGQGGDKPIAAVTPDSGRGLLRDEAVYVFDGLRTKGAVPQDVLHFLKEPSLFRITKANRMSTVHRRVHLDTIAVKCFDKKGKVTGERLFVGLLTSVAYSRSPMAIPMLRQKVTNVVGLAGFDPRSHDGKALLHILETYPRDELFQIATAELHDIAMGILHLQERQRIALFLRRDPFERFVSCLIYVPRDRFDTGLRQRFQQIVASAFEGEITAFYTHLTDAALARLHLIVKTEPGRIPEVDLAALEQSLTEAARSWEDHLEEALIEDRGEEQGIRCVRRFGTAFSAGYQEHFNAQTAVFDIRQVEAALTSGEMAMNLYRPIEAEEHQVHFKTFIAGPKVALSDILPMLENMGLRVVGEVP
ncbi:MAG: NAD-glutamate dehydrogenase, partial [Kiloniellales bacterium]|nr:NAD-glutamate dehydrogenase [Kiloniellales bacterium]